jgi:hypothetical protein
LLAIDDNENPHFNLDVQILITPQQRAQNDEPATRSRYNMRAQMMYESHAMQDSTVSDHQSSQLQQQQYLQQQGKSLVL